jgi:hypothetical protein
LQWFCASSHVNISPVALGRNQSLLLEFNANTCSIHQMKGNFTLNNKSKIVIILQCLVLTELSCMFTLFFSIGAEVGLGLFFIPPNVFANLQ